MWNFIINLGIEGQNSTQASKIKLTNLVSVITSVIALGYAAFFYFELSQPTVAMMNLLFVAAYLGPIPLCHLHHFRAAKLCFFIVMMLHVLLLSTIIFSPSSYFHVYYLIVPTGIFVLFNEEDTKEKSLVMLIAVFCFYLAVNYESAPFIKMSEQAEEIVLISVVGVIMIEVYVVMSWFSRLMHKYQTQLMLMATKDGLTSIDNRRTFITEAESMMAHSQRYKTKLSLILMDVDHFKNINDEIGHLAGDIVLKQVAQLLQENTRLSDKLARYGGEEFVLLLPETDIQQATEMAENLRQRLALSSITYQGKPLSITMSLGVTEKQVNDGDINELIKRADCALYQSKAGGRNMVIAA